VRVAFFGDSLTEGVPGSSYFAVLRRELSGHELLNYGRGNDTVVSLYHRVRRLRSCSPFDLAFLWVGVNDVSGPEGVAFPFWLVNLTSGQRRARTLDEFRAYYSALLGLLGDLAARVVAVAPALKGEDLDSDLNREVEAIARVIEAAASRRESVEFLDLRPAIARELDGRPTSSYLPRGVFGVGIDLATLRSDEQVDRKAAERGLHLTLDGIHLNSRGARLVADRFREVIERL
jgi:lysophospholipase L1-like esterase